MCTAKTQINLRIRIVRVFADDPGFVQTDSEDFQQVFLMRLIVEYRVKSCISWHDLIFTRLATPESRVNFHFFKAFRKSWWVVSRTNGSLRISELVVCRFICWTRDGPCDEIAWRAERCLSTRKDLNKKPILRSLVSADQVYMIKYRTVLTLSMLGKKCPQTTFWNIFFMFFPEIWIWHFMRMVS